MVLQVVVWLQGQWTVVDCTVTVSRIRQPQSREGKWELATLALANELSGEPREHTKA